MRRPGGQHGFGVAQGLFSLLIVGTVSAVSMPKMTEMLHQHLLMRIAQKVGAPIRGAGVLAVTTGRTIRVRFDCPGAGQYRIGEVMDRRSVDNNPNRCSLREFPHPDQRLGNGPELDGPILRLKEGVSFAAHRDFDIGPTGDVMAVGGPMPVAITVTDGELTHTLRILASGGVEN